jgi:hypothetical protein
MQTIMKNVIERHEVEYMQAYNIFVKRKEVELKNFIMEMENRTDDKKLMDQKIRKMEHEMIKAYAKQ